MAAPPGNDGCSDAGGRRRWSLRGMTALVTGGTYGIGRAVVEELAARGAAVHTCARNESELRSRLAEWDARRGGGAAITGSVCDVSVREQRERLVGDAAARFGGGGGGGGLSALVNNVGTNVGSREAHYGVHCRRVRVDHGHQPRVRVPPLPARAPAAQGVRCRERRLRVLRLRHRRRRQGFHLRHDKRRHEPAGQEPGVRMGQGQDQGELRCAMVHQDSARRRSSVEEGVLGEHPAPDAAAARRRAGGGLVAGGVPLHALRLLYHRTDHRRRRGHDRQRPLP